MACDRQYLASAVGAGSGFAMAHAPSGGVGGAAANGGVIGLRQIAVDRNSGAEQQARQFGAILLGLVARRAAQAPGTCGLELKVAGQRGSPTPRWRRYAFPTPSIKDICEPATSSAAIKIRLFMWAARAGASGSISVRRSIDSVAATARCLIARVAH